MPTLQHRSTFSLLSLSAQNLALAALAPFLLARAVGADPLAELAAFSSVKDVNVEKMAGGPAKTSRGAAMSFPRGLAVESVYVVKKPLARTAELHAAWTPSKHPELKVFIHGNLAGKPSAADFARLSSAPSTAPVKAFAAATGKLAGGPGTLQLSQAEAKAFSGDASGAMTPDVVKFWSGTLAGRAQAFVAGGMAKLPPYDAGGQSIGALDEANRLLKEAGKIRGQFAGIIDATPLGGGKGSLAPSLYWEMLDVEGQAAVSLGALYRKTSATSAQSIDLQYYSSGGFYVLITLQQMWPVTVGGQEATLVWRGDLISAASLGTLRGVERMGSSTAMMRETQKSINACLNDISKAP